MKDKWAKNVCPYCKDQGFDSIVGDVIPGETVFGFRHTMAGADDTIDFATETAGALSDNIGIQGQRIIHQMADTKYRVFITQSETGNGAAEGNATYEKTKTVTGFILYGDNTRIYDVIVVGRVLF